jgi:hypothetical protein
MPLEIREIIFGYVVASNAKSLQPIDRDTADDLREAALHGDVPRPSYCRDQVLMPRIYECGLLAANKQVHAEASRVLMETNTIHIEIGLVESQNSDDTATNRLVPVLQHAKSLILEINQVDPYAYYMGILVARTNLRSLQIVIKDESDDLIWKWVGHDEKAKKELRNFGRIKTLDHTAIRYECCLPFRARNGWDADLQEFLDEEFPSSVCGTGA